MTAKFKISIRLDQAFTTWSEARAKFHESAPGGEADKEVMERWRDVRKLLEELDEMEANLAYARRALKYMIIIHTAIPNIDNQQINNMYNVWMSEAVLPSMAAFTDKAIWNKVLESEIEAEAGT